MKGQQQAKRKRPQGGDASAAKRSKASEQPRSNYSGKAKPEKVAPKLLTKKEQKEAVKSKKLKFKKNYATIQETVVLWEQLRPKQTTKEQKEQLVSRILGKLSGHTVELANHHSASRVIQWCMKEGSAAEKAKLMAEVRSNIVELSRSKYGRHVVQKLISVAGKDEVPGIAKLFKGHVGKLMSHPAGADVLDDLYSVCPQSCRNTLCAELYGREFTLFDGVGTRSENISHLSDLLAGVDTKKRQAVVAHLYKGLAPALEKALLHPVMAHRLLRELLTEAPGSIVADVVDTLAATAGNVLKMVHTHDGAAAAAMALAYGTPKDRKRLVKGMKGYVWQTAENEWGNAVIATALSVVDDTALTGKTILPELKVKLDEMVTHKHAARVLLQLLCPDNHRYLPPAIFELLHPAHKTMMVAKSAAAGGAAGALEDDDEMAEAAADDDANQQREQDGDHDSDDVDERTADEHAGAAADSGDQPKMVEKQLGESRKDPTQRRRELLQAGGKETFAQSLVALCAEQAGQLLRHQIGCDVVVEVARGAAGGLLWELQQEGVQAVHAALVQDAAQGLGLISSSSGSKAAAEQKQQLEKDTKQKKSKAAASAQPTAAGDAEEAEQQVQEPLLTQFFASRALRRLLLAGGEAGADGAGARAFAQQLWSGALHGQCKQLVGSHGEKVLAGLLHCGVQEVEQQVAAELAPLVEGDVQAWAAQFWRPPAGQQKQKNLKEEQQQTKQKQERQQQPQQQNGTVAAAQKKKRKKSSA